MPDILVYEPGQMTSRNSQTIRTKVIRNKKDIENNAFPIHATHIYGYISQDEEETLKICRFLTVQNTDNELINKKEGKKDILINCIDLKNTKIKRNGHCYEISDEPDFITINLANSREIY